ncbi:hypothetical protein NDU88_002867 [Pleurodeles waltl]|uniref:Uncharacterized protein n=1 Tax=Pleurodeles waltl TaxID=8319 RepID=A0AAV7WRX3_PLEWA|nr:hypothetical protein NDU88_002867 [Pleurodeles waltl]
MASTSRPGLTGGSPRGLGQPPRGAPGFKAQGLVGRRLRPFGSPSGAFWGLRRGATAGRAKRTPLAQYFCPMSAPNEGTLLHTWNQPSLPCWTPWPSEPHASTGAPQLQRSPHPGQHQPERPLGRL